MQDNLVEGKLPDSLGKLEKLEVLFLHSNAMTGEIPESFFDLSDTLTDVDLGANKFTGQLSPKWGKFTNLDGLKIYNNTFTGALPNEIYDLKNLRKFQR